MIESLQIPLAFLSPEIPRLVNFIIFAAVLFYFLRKPAAEFFKQRREKLRADLERAHADRESARAKLREIESRLTHLDAEIAELKSKAAVEAQAEEARLQAGAVAEVEKLRVLARREIESATQAAKFELKSYTAAQVVEMARNLVRRELREEDHQRLVQRFTERIGEGRR
jgi:F-type H+-transporting ATPase subunit b